MDIICINQHAPALPDTFYALTLPSIVSQIARAVLVLPNPSQPTPLSRMWCIWELFLNANTPESSLSVVTPKAQLSVDEICALVKEIINLDIASSFVSKRVDRDGISSAVCSLVGCEGVNWITSSALCWWMQRVVVEALDSSDLEADIRLYNAMGLLHQAQVSQ
jgi:hypothetical protein